MSIFFNAIIFCLGIVLGVFIGQLIFKPSMYGTIVIDDTNPEKDLFTFEFSKNPGLLYDEKEVMFNVEIRQTQPSKDSQTKQSFI